MRSQRSVWSKCSSCRATERDTSLRIFHSIEHYGLDITRAVLSGGEGLANYLEAFGVDLFLSADEDDVQAAIDAGFAAGIIYPHGDRYPRRGD
ncbi:MAG: 5'-nucleotidase [Merdibacter sp.]